MRIKDRKEIVLEKLADPLPDSSQQTNEKLFNQMREDVVELGEPCYILFDIRFQRSTGFMKDVVGYIFWWVKCYLKEFYHCILSLLMQQWERPEREFEPWPLQYRCSAPPVELSGQLGAGCHVGGRGQGLNHRSGLNFSGLSCSCLSSGDDGHNLAFLFFISERF